MTRPTRHSQCLQPRSHINAIAGDVIAVDDDVDEVDADTELDALLSWLRLIVCPHRPLNVNRATKRGIRAAAFEQHSVAGGLDDPAAMFGDRWIGDALVYLS